MLILNITEVFAKVPYLQFYLQLNEDTYFAFKFFCTKNNLIKLKIITGEFNDRVILWKKKINEHLWSIFYYKRKTFYYQNGHEITKINIDEDHLEVMENFMDNYPVKIKRKRCITS